MLVLELVLYYLGLVNECLGILFKHFKNTCYLWVLNSVMGALVNISQSGKLFMKVCVFIALEIEIFTFLKNNFFIRNAQRVLRGHSLTRPYYIGKFF